MYMTTHTTNGQVNLSDFNFDIPQKVRRGGGRSNAHASDGYLTIGIKGRTRKVNNFTFSLSNFVNKNNYVGLERVSIGQHIKSKDVILAFNAATVNAVPINRFKGKGNAQESWMINNANFCLRVFELLGIDAPEKPDTSMTLDFNLDAVKDVYVLVPVSITTYDAAGQAKTMQLGGKKKGAF
jgi:hypothetical protein